MRMGILCLMRIKTIIGYKSADIFIKVQQINIIIVLMIKKNSK